MIMKIDKQNGNVAFCDSEHKYWDVTNPDKKYVSVTTLIHSYAQDFDSEFWSKYKALERLIPEDAWKMEKKSILATHKIDDTLFEIYNISKDEFNKVQQDILDEWETKKNESCKRGTAIHAELENSFYENSSRPKTLKKLGLGGKFECKKNYSDLDLEKAVYPEYLISRDSNDGKLHIAGQIDILIKNGNEIIIGDWKGLPLYTPILTSKGWSTMKDLAVGDQVFDKDGNLCNIIVKSQIHHNPCYKLIFNKNFNIVADKDHRWLVNFNNKDVVMTTEEIFKSYKDSASNIKIKIAEPLNLSKKELPINPYILGTILGLRNKSCDRNDYDKKISDYIESEELKSNSFIKNLEKLHILNSIPIPEEYILSSKEQRIELLKGLTNSCGFFDRVNNKFTIKCRHESEAKSIISLISSLGIKPEFNKLYIIAGPNESVSFEVKFNMNTNETEYWEIENIDTEETIPTQCIAVDSPSHTYLCTEYLLVTHNTNEEIKLKGVYNTKTKGTINMKYPLNNLADTNYNHYQLQLSTYAWMLQKINPDFVIKDLILYHFDHKGNETLYHCNYLKKEVERMLVDYKTKLIREEQRAKYKRIEY